MSDSKEKKVKISVYFVLGLTIASVSYAALLFFKLNNNIPFYNLLRSLIFACISFYLLLKPSKINFASSLLNSGTENTSDSNIKIARVLSILISLMNLCISMAFFYE